MAQEHEVMAFRKRLKSAGYMDVRIILDKLDPENRRTNWAYLVSALEPLAGQRIITRLTLDEMQYMFQRRKGTLLGFGILTKE